MRWTFTVRLEPQLYQFEMDRGTLLNEGQRKGDDAIRFLIWEQSRGFAVAAYEAVLGAAAAAVGTTGFDISAEMMQAIVQEDQRREIGQLLDQVETLTDEKAKLEARLDEHRRFIGRHALEIVSEDEPFVSRQERAAARELEDKPPFHELLMLGDKEYKAAVEFLADKGLIAAKANDQAGRDFIVSTAAAWKGEQ